MAVYQLDYKHRFANIFERYTALLLTIILLLALLVRVAALLSLKSDLGLYFDTLIYDEKLYHQWASSMAKGTDRVVFAYDFASLPAYVFALVYKILSPNPLYIRITNILFSLITCYLIYLIGRDLAGKTTGLISAFIAALYKPFIFFSIVVQKTSLSLVLFSLMIWVFIDLMKKVSVAEDISSNTSMVKILGFGMVMGLLINVRSNCLILVPFLPLLMFWSHPADAISFKMVKKVVVLYLVGLLVSTAPFVVKNYRDSGVATMTPMSGPNLYLGNNLQNPYPYYRPVSFASSAPSQQATHFIIEASRRKGRKLSVNQASSYWTGQVIKTAVNQPAAFMAKLSQKALSFFNKFEAADNHDIEFISEFLRLFMFPFIGIGLILPLGMAHMLIKSYHNRKCRALCIIFLLYTVSLVIFFTNVRLRLPLLIILIPFAVQGVGQWVSNLKHRHFRTAGIYFAVTLVFFVLESLPVRGADDMTSALNTHALILDARGFEAEAMDYWKRSSKMEQSYSVYANLALSRRYYEKGDVTQAFSYLDKIPDDSIAGARKYGLAGKMLEGLGEEQSAIRAYEKSLYINSGQQEIRTELIGLYDKWNQGKAKKEIEMYKYIGTFYRYR